MARATVACSNLIGWTHAFSRSPGVLAIVWQLEFCFNPTSVEEVPCSREEEAGQGLTVTWACPVEEERLRGRVWERETLCSADLADSEIAPLITVFCQMSLLLLKSLSSIKGQILHLFSSLLFSEKSTYNVTQDFSKSSRTLLFKLSLHLLSDFDLTGQFFLLYL